MFQSPVRLYVHAYTIIIPSGWFKLCVDNLYPKQVSPSCTFNFLYKLWLGNNLTNECKDRKNTIDLLYKLGKSTGKSGNGWLLCVKHVSNANNETVISEMIYTLP